MIETRFYEALASEARCAAGLYRVYGYTLAPFSFRHALQLAAIDSPLATGTPWTDLDLLIAARICSARTFSPAPIPGKWSGLWRRSCFAFQSELAAFTEYFHACYAQPERYDRGASGGGGSRLEAPMELVIITYILRKSHGYTAEELWTMPAGLTWWIYESLKEQETGDSDIVSERTQREIELASTDEARDAMHRAELYLAHVSQRESDGLKLLLDPGAYEEFIRTGEVPEDFQP